MLTVEEEYEELLNIYEKDTEKLRCEKEELKKSLIDMLNLIEEHGKKEVITHHATRIMKAYKSLKI